MTMLNKPQQNDDETRSASRPTDDGHRGNRMSLETATLLAACLSGCLFLALGLRRVIFGRRGRLLFLGG